MQTMRSTHPWEGTLKYFPAAAPGRETPSTSAAFDASRGPMENAQQNPAPCWSAFAILTLDGGIIACSRGWPMPRRQPCRAISALVGGFARWESYRSCLYAPHSCISNRRKGHCSHLRFCISIGEECAHVKGVLVVLRKEGDAGQDTSGSSP
jgi:hypothetical protein